MSSRSIRQSRPEEAASSSITAISRPGRTRFADFIGTRKGMICTSGMGKSSPIRIQSGQRNSLEVWHLGRGPLTHPWGWKRTFEEMAFYDENVPGNKPDGGCTNYESIALVGHNGTFGSGPHQRTMFLIKDDEYATKDTTPIRSFLLPHLPTVDLNNDGVVDQLDEAILIEAFRTNDLKFDVNGDGKLDQLDFAEVVAEELVEIEE